MARKRKLARGEKSERSVSLPPGVDESAFDLDLLRELIELLESSSVVRLSWRRGKEQLVIRRDSAQAPSASAAAPSAAASRVPAEAAARAVAATPAPPSTAVAAKPGQVVTSPFVGTFYRTPAPDQPPFVEVGSVVRKGQVLCIIEAMKLMNEIESEIAGAVMEILAENGQPVEFGQPLFRIEPA
jgi:acetyl-CoA carboxylase biotin carboxyl carrier protein